MHPPPQVEYMGKDWFYWSCFKNQDQVRQHLPLKNRDEFNTPVTNRLSNQIKVIVGNIPVCLMDLFIECSYSKQNAHSTGKLIQLP